MSMITVIGRGHSGTRALSHTLSASGVFMGDTLNGSGDLLPPEAMYDACRVMARHLEWDGALEWDWGRIQAMDVPREFEDLIRSYLHSVLESNAAHTGWKIPETTLCFPWIARLFPEIKYVFWIRDPRDCIRGTHITDDLHDFDVPYPETTDERLRRAISWVYQYKLVAAMPRPRHWLEVRFEDFVLKQDETLARLEDFLHIPLARIPVRPEAVGRWARDELDSPPLSVPEFLQPAMREYGYLSPSDG